MRFARVIAQLDWHFAGGRKTCEFQGCHNPTNAVQLNIPVEECVNRTVWLEGENVSFRAYPSGAKNRKVAQICSHIEKYASPSGRSFRKVVV